MTEKEYRLAHFEENLAPYRGRQIFLYGWGANTRALLEHFDADFAFAGLIVPDEAAEQCLRESAPWKKPVLTLAQALEKKAEIILIAAQMYGAEAVYQRIHADCAAHGVLLLDMYGTDQCALHAELESQGFLDLPGWRRLTAPYDAVSFELLDTVLVRDLLQNRRPSVRPVMKRLIAELAAAGKSILFLASPEYEETWYREALTRAGIPAMEDGADCRLILRDEKERFFRDLKEALPGKHLLHIGSHLLEDGIMPRLCGVDARKLVFYDRRTLTAFEKRKKEAAGPERPDRAAVLRAIDAADVVSFDLFDTLLVRCVPEPADVAALTAYRADCLQHDAELRERFYRIRLQEQCGEKTLPQIYGAVAERLGLPAADADELQRLERQTEREVISLREPVADLVRYAKERGRYVVICSDMYCTGAELAALLREKGLTGFDRIIVSCEYGLGKTDGLLEEVRKAAAQLCGKEDLPAGASRGGQDPARAERSGTDDGNVAGKTERPCRVLHIGDSIQADELPAERAGIGCFRLPSVWETAQTAGLFAPGAKEAGRQNADAEDAFEAGLSADMRERLPSRAELAARSLYGLWCAERFADPFAKAGKETGRDAQLKNYGKAALAPVLTGFLLHLMSEIAADAPDRVLFAARDGWLLQQWYQKTRWEALPPADYFYTSRHAALLPLADRPELAGYLADMAEGMSCAEMMRAFFDTGEQELHAAVKPAVSPCDTEQRGLCRAQAGRNERFRYLLDHQRDLAPLAAEAARGQRAYWDRLRLTEGLRCAYVDFVATGTSQRLTEEAAPFALTGYYVGRPENGTEPACEIRSWLDGRTEAGRQFLGRYLEMEYYMTSPESSLRGFSPDGTPQFAEEVRTAEELAEIAAVHAAAQEVFDRFAALADWDRNVRKAADPAAFVRELTSMIPVELICRMALSCADSAPKQRYFDDWSKRWIQDE